MSRCPFSPTLQKKWSSETLRFIKTICSKNCVVFFVICLGVLVSQKMKIDGVGKKGHVRKSRNHENAEFEGSPISKSKSYKFKLKQNNITELLNIYFHKFIKKIAHKSQQMLEMRIFRILYRNPVGPVLGTCREA